MLDTRPQDREQPIPSLFEAWMGMTEEEWDALGGRDETELSREPHLL
jgi:hypothetical protein